MTLEIYVKDCRDCPMRKSEKGHGECFEYCSHKDAPKGYDNILWGCQGSFSILPKWCPIKKRDKNAG